MSMKGMIIRCSSIIPEIREAIFRCLVCGYYSDPIVVDRGKVSDCSVYYWFVCVVNVVFCDVYNFFLTDVCYQGELMNLQHA